MKRKLRGALRVVDLQAEVARLHALVPPEPPRRRGTPLCLHSAWYEAADARTRALLVLWRVSPKRGEATAKRLGLAVPTQLIGEPSLSRFDGSSRHEEPPCGKPLLRSRLGADFCMRPRGHRSECSYNRYY